MSGEKTTVLVVNNHEASRYAIARILREGGFNVIEAATGNKALKKAGLEVSLVILDIDLPDIDGYEVCRRLKADPATSSILIIHLTATHLTLQDKLAGLNNGADGYFFQPIEPSELLANINVVLRIRHLRLEEGLEAHRWRAAFDAVSDPICLLDHEGRIVRYNRAFQEISGCDDSELTGKFCHNVLHHTSTFIAHCPFIRARETGKSEELEVLVSGRWYRIRVGPIADQNREPASYVHVMVDITERKQAEASLKQEQELYRDLIRAMPTGIYRLRVRPTEKWTEKNWLSQLEEYFSVDMVSDRFSEISGIGKDEFLANPKIVPDRIHPEDHTDFARKNIDAQTSSSHFIWEGRMVHPDKGIIWVHFESIPRILENGETIWTGILYDISERKKNESELKASEKRYHELFQVNPQPMWVYDLETLRFLDVNDAAVAHYKYSRNEFLAMTIKDIRPAGDIPRLMERIAHVDRRVRNSGIWQHMKKDGSIIDVEIISHSLVYDKRPTRMVLVRDITEQLRIEAVSKRLMTAIEQTDETIVITDPNGVVQYVNPAFERITGYTSEEAIGTKPSIFKSGEHNSEFYAELWRTITSGSVWRGRFVNRRKDGSLYNEDAVISPVCDPSGRIVNYVAVKRDITESLKLEAQLQQAQKMESIGRLAGGVAHDFNNMLSVILGYTQLALEKTDPTDLLHNDLQEVYAAATRSASITRQLLAFARKQTVTPRVLDLNETVEGMLSMLRRLIGEDITLTWRPGNSLHAIKVDPSQIDQILANLCVNARDAITGVGNITIETAMVSLDTSYCAYHAGAVPGDYVFLAVSDDGCGMERQILDKIFEPFFTTKDMGKGTGLGLATVYGIVKQNNGFITVFSEPDRGTTFKIYLPRYREIKSEGREEVTTTVQPGHGETILVVEDEPAILRLTGTILKNLGYNVLTANTPKQALSLAQGQSDRIHLLITDVIMPEMNGHDLADLLLSFYPNLRCLFMSGYTANVISDKKVPADGMNFIQKPFSKKDLGDKVREILLS